MSFSLGKCLRATRELLGLTQEQVIEQLENQFGILMSQQTLSTIENGKRKVDAESELPAFAYIYSKPINYFYENWSFTLATEASTSTELIASLIDFDSLTQRDKLELAFKLLQSVLAKDC